MKSGPFGFAMAMTLDELGADLQEVAPYKYLVPSAPKPHPAFEQHFVQVTPQHGLSWLKVISHPIPTNSFGGEIKSAFASMLSKLEHAYGKHCLYDNLLDGSIWNEPRDWMQALLLKERMLMAEWDRSSGAALRDDLISLALLAATLTLDEGFITIEYNFRNYDDANAEIAREQDSVL